MTQIQTILDHLKNDPEITAILAQITAGGHSFDLEGMVKAAYDKLMAQHAGESIGEEMIYVAISAEVAMQAEQYMASHPAKGCFNRLVHRVIHALSQVIGK